MSGGAGAAALAEARRWIGTPYVHGASLRGVGCDCLGLVRGVWRALYGPEPEPTPPYRPDWAEARGRDLLFEAASRRLAPLPLDRVQPGDLLLFRWRDGAPAKHCGVAAAPGWMVHAHDGACVAEAPMGVWRPRLAAAFRFPEPESAP